MRKRWLIGSLVIAVLIALLEVPATAVVKPPTISGFSPPSGSVGALVTVTGTVLTGASSVAFNSTPASFTVVSATEIVATVPPTATSGKISVTTVGGTGLSASNFTVNPAPQLLADGAGGLSYTYAGGRASIFGFAFASNEAVDVYFDQTDELVAATNTGGSFGGSFKVPKDAVPGDHYITAVGRRAGEASSVTFGVHTDWTAQNFDSSRINDNRHENVLSSSNVAELDSNWSRKITTATWVQPLVADGYVFVASTDGDLYQLDETSGAVVQTYNTAAAINVTPVIDPVNSVIVVGNSAGKFYGYNYVSHSLLWGPVSTTASGVNGPLADASGFAYAVTNDGTLRGFNDTTGASIGTFGDGGVLPTGGGESVSAPTVADGTVAFMAKDGSTHPNLYLFNVGPSVVLRNSIVLYAGYYAGVDSAPLIVGDNIFFIADRPGISCDLWESTIDAEYAQPDTNLQPDFPCGQGVDPPMLRQGKLFTDDSEDGVVVSIDPFDGAQLTSMEAAVGPSAAGDVLLNSFEIWDGTGSVELWSTGNFSVAAAWVVTDGRLLNTSGTRIRSYTVNGDPLARVAWPDAARLRPNYQLAVPTT